jgi:CIC family chloride channel protein
MSYIVISAITGSVLSRIFWGDFPAFKIIPFAMESYWELSAYLMLGVAAGLLSILFVRLLFRIDSLFSSSPVPDWLSPALGGALLGCLALGLPQVLGVGYETVNAALTDSLTLKMALILLAAKLMATAVCIGSGMSGGIFAPSLFLGAVLGTAVGFGAEALWPAMGGNPAFFALAGMGAVVSGTTLAPITAIVTIFELTLHYQVILPLMAACITATLVVRFLFGYSVYELKLLRRGVNLVRGHDVAILRNIPVKDVMRRDIETVSASSTLEDVMDDVLKSPFPHFVVLDDQGKLSGILSLRDLRRFLVKYDDIKSTTTVRDMMSTEVVTIKTWDTMEKALQLFEEHRFSMVPVVGWDTGTVQGIMVKDDLLKAYDERVLKDRVLSIAKK